ncbi:heat-inducible transcriptional repressor HrcA [Rhodomicrobium lacus]|uniref:heat-inducible transcriptional repressor HrcA n=1 Tax=Rhodomicrobium lacus TaxID=2498452 RepID=UPI0026E4915D|nr:heat-inducible transcriptional repressor HrcA [Rhodomicrobium lacus]WKW49908.1 heat-inducible transcriptional repressor HrcA [Rhodomicrobium lacus]
MSKRQELRAPALELSQANGLRELNERYREIFRSIVETYLETGEPVGSRHLSRQLPMTLSPASVRNVMSDLEAQGLIYAPHVSAGRIPTQTGLRLFVDGLLEVGSIEETEREQLERQLLRDYHREHAVTSEVLAEAGDLLSGLSRCAGVVLAEKQVSRLKHIEFVSLDSKRALLVLAGDDGSVENRVLNLPEGLPPQALVEATNYLNAKIRGVTLPEAREKIEGELKARQAELDALTAKLVRSGLAQWSGGREDNRSLIVRGQSRLLNDLRAVEDLERIRLLFEDLESQKALIHLLDLAEEADGVRIFIGSENNLFSLSGSSLIVAPFQDHERKIVGVLGVIGPTRLNYGRIIPMVDFTAKLVSRVLA